MTPIQAAYGVARQGLRPAIPAGAPPKLAQLIQVRLMVGAREGKIGTPSVGGQTASAVLLSDAHHHATPTYTHIQNT